MNCWDSADNRAGPCVASGGVGTSRTKLDEITKLDWDKNTKIKDRLRLAESSQINSRLG